MLYCVGKYLQGNIRDSRNLIRDCTKKKIGNPWLMDEEHLNVELFLCKKKIQELKACAPSDCCAHLKKTITVSSRLR